LSKRDEQEAMDKAMRELNIREAARIRISVRREQANERHSAPMVLAM
jgi:hypothetical protein